MGGPSAARGSAGDWAQTSRDLSAAVPIDTGGSGGPLVGDAKDGANLNAMGKKTKENPHSCMTQITPDKAVWNDDNHQIVIGKNGEILVSDRVGQGENVIPNFVVKGNKLTYHNTDPATKDKQPFITVDIPEQGAAFDLSGDTRLYIQPSSTKPGTYQVTITNRTGRDGPAEAQTGNMATIDGVGGGTDFADGAFAANANSWGAPDADAVKAFEDGFNWPTVDQYLKDHPGSKQTGRNEVILPNGQKIHLPIKTDSDNWGDGPDNHYGLIFVQPMTSNKNRGMEGDKWHDHDIKFGWDDATNFGHGDGRDPEGNKPNLRDGKLAAGGMSIRSGVEDVSGEDLAMFINLQNVFGASSDPNPPVVPEKQPFAVVKGPGPTEGQESGTFHTDGQKPQGPGGSSSSSSSSDKDKSGGGGGGVSGQATLSAWYARLGVSAPHFGPTYGPGNSKHDRTDDDESKTPKHTPTYQDWVQKNLSKAK